MKFLLVLTTILLFGRINCQGTISEELDNLGLTTALQLLDDTGLIDTLEGLGMLREAKTQRLTQTKKVNGYFLQFSSVLPIVWCIIGTHETCTSFTQIVLIFMQFVTKTHPVC